MNLSIAERNAALMHATVEPLLVGIIDAPLEELRTLPVSMVQTMLDGSVYAQWLSEYKIGLEKLLKLAAKDKLDEAPEAFAALKTIYNYSIQFARLADNHNDKTVEPYLKRFSDFLTIILGRNDAAGWGAENRWVWQKTLLPHMDSLTNISFSRDEQHAIYKLQQAISNGFCDCSLEWLHVNNLLRAMEDHWRSIVFMALYAIGAIKQENNFSLASKYAADYASMVSNFQAICALA
jgi:hypothetical protein